jgi:hypothetical protein
MWKSLGGDKATQGETDGLVSLSSPLKKNSTDVEVSRRKREERDDRNTTENEKMLLNLYIRLQYTLSRVLLNTQHTHDFCRQMFPRLNTACPPLGYQVVH